MLPPKKHFSQLPISALVAVLFFFGRGEFANDLCFYRRLNRRELTCITTLSFLRRLHSTLHSEIRPPLVAED